MSARARAGLVLVRHAQASAWAVLVVFAQEEGTRLVRGPADTARHLRAGFVFRVEIVISRSEKDYITVSNTQILIRALSLITSVKIFGT